MESTTKQVSTVSLKKGTWRTVAGIVVIIILLSGGVWATTRVSPFLSNGFQTLLAAVTNFSQTFIPAERLSASVSQETIQSGDKVFFSWVHHNQRGTGTYAISYPCEVGVYLGLATDSGESMILCDTPTQVKGENNTVVLRGLSHNNETSQIPITLTYTRAQDSTSSLSATVILSIINENPGATSTAPAEQATTTVMKRPEPSPSAPSTPAKRPMTAGTRTEKTYLLGSSTPSLPPYGKADLAPRILEVGTIDKVTNQFTATTTLRASDRIAVRFEVENLGTADSGMWSFSAVLPTYPMNIFQSDTQQSLSPGDRIEYTIGFDQVEPDVDGRFVINVNPNGSISEVTRENNIATTTIRASL